ncbi:MAG: SDR family oxidoreductase [Desulfuromonadales bacterium]|nr:SDR family oxidoreductase [Desulfuromonadales bacterium]
MKNSKSLPEILIVGCGDIGVRVAQLEKRAGRKVSGLVRSEEGAERLRSHGIEPVMGTLDDLASLNALPTAGKLVCYFAPPTGGGPFDSRMRSFCQAVGAGALPDKVVYMSTSGVYGDCGSEWVTEETPLNPQTSRAQRRVDAETTLQEWGREHSVPIVILRVTGIYGPGRLPLARIQQGHPVLREGDSPPTNRIHADDLAVVCVKAAEKAADGDIFNVSDGQPGTMTQYFNLVSDLLDLPTLPQVDMEEAKRVMNPMMLSYLTESRRMDNRKMIDQLGVILRYPNLEAGLKNVVAQLNKTNMGYLGSIGH